MNRHGERFTYPDYGRDEILRDFQGHTMSIERDDGVHRHLRFRAPGTITYWFDIVTWQGVLVINGDCGTYVFSRLPDMFEFFRQPNGKARINPSYWAGKLHATDCHGTRGHVEYSERKGREALASEMRSLREQGASNDVLRDLLDSAVWDEDASRLIESVTNWSRDDFTVSDFWEHNFEDFTRRFIWNLHAIVWGIAQYDESKVSAGAMA